MEFSYNLDRDAYATIAGFVLQVDLTVLRWLNLDDSELLELECGEDIDLVGTDIRSSISVGTRLFEQVKRHQANITLRSQAALEALANFAGHRAENPEWRLRFRLLTTAKIGREQQWQGDIEGIRMWEALRTGDMSAEARPKSVQQIRSFLLGTSAPDHISTVTWQTFQDVVRSDAEFGKFINDFEWSTSADDYVAVQRKVRASLIKAGFARDEKQAEALSDQLFAFVFRFLSQAGTKRLKRSHLLAEISRSTQSPADLAMVIFVRTQMADFATRMTEAERRIQVIEEIVTVDNDKTIEVISSAKEFDLQELRQVAAALLAASFPPSLLPLFPDAQELGRRALEELTSAERTITREPAAASPEQQISLISDLFVREELHHLLLAAPGSGKTHSLWHAAQQQLSGGGLVPIFLSMGELASWDDAAGALAEVAKGAELQTLINDSRVCFMLDGWSEFASKGGGEERTRALRSLNRTRVIANGRRPMATDSRFQTWRLNALSVSSVMDTIKIAYPDSSPPGPDFLELLRLPLALSLFILLGGSALSRGELITRLHNHLSRNLPEGFRSILGGAVASLTLSEHEYSYVRLEEEIRRRAKGASLVNPIQILRELGTLEDRMGKVLPVHDLYWSWLAGLGFIEEDETASALPNLDTRESYELALESGVRPTPSMVLVACKTDITVAGLFISEQKQDSGALEPFRSTLSAMFADERLAVRCRAAMAVLRSRRADRLKLALEAIAEMRAAKLYGAGLEFPFQPKDLYSNRGIVSEWLGADGTEEMIDAVASRGHLVWGAWLEQMVHSGKLSAIAAAGAAVACTGRVPEWTVPHLFNLVATHAWKLRPSAMRANNRALANWIVGQYEQLTELGGSQWFEMNKVLVACGNDATFEDLLALFPAMSVKAQEVLGYAIVDRGEPWIAAFQKIAFASGTPQHHYQLLKIASLGIDDGTARRWILQGPAVLGWRVLIARYGTAVLPEMLANLPDTFDGMHNCPALAAMEFLPPAPDSLTGEIMKRIQGTMQPKAMQDAINALARVRPGGLLQLVVQLSKNPRWLPTYHLAQFLDLVRIWEQESQQTIMLRSNLGATSFAEWIVASNITQGKNEARFCRTIARNKDLAMRIIFDYLSKGDSAVKSIVENMDPMESYHERLFELLLTDPSLSALIPKVFSGALDTFPEKALERAINSPDVPFGDLLRSMAVSSSPVHSALHKAIVTSVLAQPIDLFRYRDVAKILRIYQREQILEVLKSTIPAMTSEAVWMIREIELERRQLLIDEECRWFE
jgi:hypothetical protein